LGTPEVIVKCPATSANLGSGFDVCGLALEAPFNLMRVGLGQKNRFTGTGGYPLDAAKVEDMLGPVIARAKEFTDSGVEVSVDAGIKPRSGLGASAAVSAGLVFALDKLLGLKLPATRLIEWAGLGEVAADMEPHYDNVAPALLGGFTAVCSSKPLRVKRFEPPAALECLLAIPDKEKESTAAARKLLPETIRRRDALSNSTSLASLLCGFATGDVEAIISGMEDRVVEPVRESKGFYPCLSHARVLGKKLGYGVAGSGAGPSILAIGDRANADRAAFEGGLKKIYSANGVGATFLWTRPSSKGVEPAPPGGPKK